MLSSVNKVITFVVPAYNVERYIGQCLESLVRQTSKRFCAIVVDDGSTDGGTARIAQEYAAAHSGLIYYVRQENKGLGAARNTGLSRVKTPFVTFLDSDDWLDVRYVETIINSLERWNDDSIDIIFTLPTVYDTITNQMWEWMDKELFDRIFPSHAPVIDMAIDERPYYLEPNACRRVLRTDFLRRNHFRFPEGTRWEDVLPHFQLLTRAKRCMGVGEVGFFYRINVPTSITATSGRGRLEVVSVFDSAFKYLLEGGYNANILNSCLLMCVRFSMWSISMSQQKVRGPLVESLHKLYTSLPKSVISAAMHSRNLLNRKERLFVRTVKSRVLHKLLIDYLPASATQILFDKLRAVKRRLHL